MPDGPGAAGGDEQGDLYGRIAVSLTVLAFLLHAGGVLSRALSVQRAPWGNMYEFSITFSTVAVGAYLGCLLALKKNVRWIGLPLVTTVLLDLGLAVTVLYTDSDQLVPALHSYWLWIHVSHARSSAARSSTSAPSRTLLYLFRDRYENKLANGGKPGRLRHVRPGAAARRPPRWTSSRTAINAAVFPLWTFTIIAGAIWAGDAWGRYWGWDPKEVWSFITWVAYACYLHARATAGWKGRKAAYLALIAFALLPVQLLRREHLRHRQALLRRASAEPHRAVPRSPHRRRSAAPARVASSVPFSRPRDSSSRRRISAS